MDAVLEDDLVLLQRLWPAGKFGLRREAARLLLQDPDHRLRTVHLEVLLNATLKREVTSLELQAELCNAECSKYFSISPDASEWQLQVVKLLLDAVYQDAKQTQSPQPPKLLYQLACAAESEKDQRVLLAVVNTWSNYEQNDEDYLAVVIAWVLITKKDSKGQLPIYSLHLTDVGGFLRSLTVSDDRLAHIFPRAGGGVFVSKRQKQAAKARPRLSEYLMQPHYRPYFCIKDSSMRKSEKVVSLVVERLLQNIPADMGLHMIGTPAGALALGSAAPALGMAAKAAAPGTVAAARPAQCPWQAETDAQQLSAALAQVTAAAPVALLPDFLDGMDAAVPMAPAARAAAGCETLQGIAGRLGAESAQGADATAPDTSAVSATTTPMSLEPYLDPVISHPIHSWHQRSTSLFSHSSVGSPHVPPPMLAHLNSAAHHSRFSSHSFPDLNFMASVEGLSTAGPEHMLQGSAPNAGTACSNLMAAFRPESRFFAHPPVAPEYVPQVPDVIAKCWAASLDELMTKTTDGLNEGSGRAATQMLAGAVTCSGTIPSGTIPSHLLDGDCSDEESVSLENCMIPDDSDCCESGDEAEHVIGSSSKAELGSSCKGAAGSGQAGSQQTLKVLSTANGVLTDTPPVPSFAPSTPSFFQSPSQQRAMHGSTDSDDTHSSTRSSSDDASEACTSPSGNFPTGAKASSEPAASQESPEAAKSPSTASVTSVQTAARTAATTAPAAVTGLANWAAIAAKHTEPDGKGSAGIVFAPPPSAESKVIAAAAAAQVTLPPGVAKNLAKLSPRLREEVLKVVRTCPAMKLEDFDEGVVSQLMGKKSEEDAAAAIKSISQHDLTNIQHMAAFINFVVKNFAGAASGITAARGSIGGLVSRASSVPVSSRTILQKLPLKVYKHLEDVVNSCSFLEWKHFDAGVVKVLSQLAKMADADVCEELDILLQTDLSNVEYMPAYLNKRFNNRLWSRRKVSS